MVRVLFDLQPGRLPCLLSFQYEGCIRISTKKSLGTILLIYSTVRMGVAIDRVLLAYVSRRL